MIGQRPLFSPGATWFRLADWLAGAVLELQRLRRRGRGR